MRGAQAPAGRDAAQHPIKPTAPVARASGGEARLEASLLAEGLSPQPRGGLCSPLGDASGKGIRDVRKGSAMSEGVAGGPAGGIKPYEEPRA